MAIILWNMLMFEKENTVFFRVLCFLYVCIFLGYQIGLKSVFF